MSINATTALQKVIDELTAALPNAAKFDKGIASAAPKVRNAASKAMKDLQTYRKEVQALKNARSAKKS